MLRLSRNIDVDTDAVITEFTDSLYGHAGPLVRQYIDELEKARKQMTLPRFTGYKSSDFSNDTFPYLTPENLHHWQQMFSKMLKRVNGQPVHELNVELLRRELDYATLLKWNEMTQQYPDVYTDYRVLVERIDLADRSSSITGARIQPTISNALPRIEPAYRD